MAKKPDDKQELYDVGETTDVRERNADGTFKRVVEEETPAKPETNPTKTSEETQKPKDEFREYLTRQALEYGFDEAEVQDISNAALAKTVHKLAKQREQLRAEYQNQLLMRDGPQRQESVNPAPQPQPKPPEDDDDFDIDEEELHPSIAKALKAIKKRLPNSKKIKELEDRINDSDQRQQRSEVRLASDVVDQVFDSLANEKVFGKGSGADLVSDNPAQFKRRVACLNEAGVDMRNLPPAAKLKSLLKAAADTLFPPADVYTQAQDKSPVTSDPKANGRIKPDQWNATATEKPTQRTDEEEAPGVKRATKNMAKRMKDAGLTPIMSTDNDDFIP